MIKSSQYLTYIQVLRLGVHTVAKKKKKKEEI